MPDTGNILTVEDLCYSYGDRCAVRAVSFEVHSGEIFGFLGPNGAGKTTTIACLSGLRANWQGKLTFAGRPFQPTRRAEDRRKLGVVPQELALCDGLTGRENVGFFGTTCGMKGSTLKEAVDRALQLAGLTDRADERVEEYSGGMKRRLNFVVGDLHQPELLLLDEPTVGVDPQSRSHLFEALRTLRDAGRSLFYTTHYMEEAQRLCDRVAIMNEGSIMAVGTAEELATAAGTPEVDLEDVFLKLTGRSLRD